MTCPTCGGVVQDHVCTNCGAAVWPDNDDATGDEGTGAGAATPPPPPSAGSSGPTFVNPPDEVTPMSPATPPPPSAPSTPPPPTPPGPPGGDGGWPTTPVAPGEWQPSTTPASSSSSGSGRKVLLWVLGGFVVLAVLGVVGIFLLLRGAGVSPGDLANVGQGSPERLGQLRSACEGGDMQACDDLYLESPFDSEDEAFGDTCGNRNEPAGWCVDIYGETAP